MEKPYQANKARVLVMFIAGQLEIVDYTTIWKIFYLCERWHFERYGQPIVGDTYLAARAGPIPLQAMHAFLANKNGNQESATFEHVYRGLPMIDKARLRTLANETFACDELHSIHWALATFGALPAAIFDESIRGIAWKSAGDSEFFWPNKIGEDRSSSTE